MRIPVLQLPRHKRLIPRPLPVTFNSKRHGARSARTSAASSTTGTKKKSGPLFVARPWIDRFVLDVHTHAYGCSGNHIWVLVNRLSQYRHHLPLVEALRNHGVSVQEFRTRWQDVVRTSDAAIALDALGSRQATASAPPWLLIHIVSHLVKTPVQAERIMGMILNRLGDVEPAIAPWMLVILAHALARHNMLAQLRRVITMFLDSPTPTDKYQFKHLLLATARVAPTSDAAHTVIRLLQVMVTRQYAMDARMLRELTSNRRLIIALNHTLRDQLASRGTRLAFIPTEHLVRFFTSNVASIEQSGSGVVPINGRFGELLETIVNPRWQSIRSRKIGLLHSEQVGPRKLGVITHQDPSKVNVMQMVYAARDVSRTTGPDLLTHLANVPPGSVTATSIATAMRGLYLRQEYVAVHELWKRLEASNLRVTEGALDIIVRTLANTGGCREAFDLLEKYRKATNATLPGRGSTAIVGTGTINALCSGFIRSNRPDLVLRMWDDMELLYGVHPNNYTLKLVLGAAARVGPLVGSTLRGAMAQLRVPLPFRKPYSPQPHPSRLAAVVALRRSLQYDHVPSGQWHGVDAAEAAGRVFKQVVLGNAPELLNAQAPAYALRQHADDAIFHPFSELRTAMMGSSFARVPITLESHTIQALAAQGLYPPPFPNLRADKKAFKLYITLLGSSGRASEIALALAWMRMLNVQPSRKVLALALIYWGEVSMAAPWLEARAQRTAKSQYARLMDWMRDWVGEKNMPQDFDMRNSMQWMRKREERRAGRRDRTGSGHDEDFDG